VRSPTHPHHHPRSPTRPHHHLRWVRSPTQSATHYSQKNKVTMIENITIHCIHSLLWCECNTCCWCGTMSNKCCLSRESRSLSLNCTFMPVTLTATLDIVLINNHTRPQVQDDDHTGVHYAGWPPRPVGCPTARPKEIPVWHQGTSECINLGVTFSASCTSSYVRAVCVCVCVCVCV
jgi:hypothetical protein